MERVTISQLRNDLSALLRKVRAGETVLILDRNRPVARIERIGAEGQADDRLAHLERQGLLRRALQPFPRKMLEKPPPTPGKSVLDTLIEERRKGR